MAVARVTGSRLVRQTMERIIEKNGRWGGADTALNPSNHFSNCFIFCRVLYLYPVSYFQPMKPNGHYYAWQRLRALCGLAATSFQKEPRNAQQVGLVVTKNFDAADQRGVPQSTRDFHLKIFETGTINQSPKAFLSLVQTFREERQRKWPAT